MSEPKRLLEELGGGFEHELLGAGARERAPERARERVRSSALAALVVPAPVVLAEATAAAKGSSSLLGAALKWLAVGAVLGGVSGEVSLQVTSRGTRYDDSVEAPAITRAAPVAANAKATLDVPAAAEPAAQSEGKESSRAATAKGNVLIGTADLELESQSLDHVRFVGAQNPERGLEALDRHEARFPHGSLGGDAKQLRVRLRGKLSR